MPIRVLDMFCGAGGCSAGARLAGAQILRGIDAWDLATSTFKDNFTEAEIETRRLGPYSRPRSSMSEGEIDLLIASPECTNHSPAKGSRPRSEKSRQTANYVLNFARKLKPRWVVLENVVQLRSWSGYTPLMAELQNIGYSIQPQVLDASDFGVPQARRRLFVICDRARIAPIIKTRKSRVKTAADVIQLDGPWPFSELFSKERAKPTLERANRAIRALGKGVPFLIVYYGSDGAGGWQTLDRPLRTLTTLDRFGLVTWQGRDPMLRMLQIDELRGAMGFHPSYSLNHGTRRDRIKLLGNGVSPPVMQAIVETLTSA